MNVADDNQTTAELVTFGKRDPNASLDRRAPRMGARTYDGPWSNPSPNQMNHHQHNHHHPPSSYANGYQGKDTRPHGYGCTTEK